MFGKVSVNKKKKSFSKVDKVFGRENNVKARQDIANEQQRQIETDKNILSKLKDEKGRAAAIFKLKDKVIGPRKSPLEPAMIVDPESGVEIFEPEDIKRVSLKYCVELLTNRTPKEEYRELFKEKEGLHWLRMSESIENDLEELTPEMFDKTLNMISRKPGEKYNFILKGGKSLKMLSSMSLVVSGKLRRYPKTGTNQR